MSVSAIAKFILILRSPEFLLYIRLRDCLLLWSYRILQRCKKYWSLSGFVNSLLQKFFKIYEEKMGDTGFEPVASSV